MTSHDTDTGGTNTGGTNTGGTDTGGTGTDTGTERLSPLHDAHVDAGRSNESFR